MGRWACTGSRRRVQTERLHGQSRSHPGARVHRAVQKTELQDVTGARLPRRCPPGSRGRTVRDTGTQVQERLVARPASFCARSFLCTAQSLDASQHVGQHRERDLVFHPPPPAPPTCHRYLPRARVEITQQVEGLMSAVIHPPTLDATTDHTHVDATLTDRLGDARRVMGILIGLDEIRAERRTRAKQAAERGSRHPALRWVAGDTWYLAHRKLDGVAACGAAGDLILAPRGTPLCEVCYPRAQPAGE